MAIDKIPLGEIRSTAERLFAEADIPEGAHLMALMDHSLAPDMVWRDRWPGVGPITHNLIGHISGADERFSPILIGLPSAQKSRVDAVLHLLRRCNGQPMLSILVSPLSLQAMAAHLAQFTEITLPPDGSNYFLRLGDTRIVPILDSQLDPAQRAQIFDPLLAWAYLDREGAWAVIRGKGLKDLMPGTPLALSDGQFEAFIRATMPDNFIAQLRVQFPAFAEIEPSGQYRLVCHWIKEANLAASGLAESGDCLANCIANLAAVQ